MPNLNLLCLVWGRFLFSGPMWGKYKINTNYFYRINGGTSFKLNGSCKIHGNSKDSVNADPTQKVFIFPAEWFRASSSENHFLDKHIILSSQPRAQGSKCKPGHLCPEIYKALDGILFIAETKKSQEEKMRVSRQSRKSI